MLTNPKTSHGAEKNERYLIATTTTPGRPEEPCIRPPAEREADFRGSAGGLQTAKIDTTRTQTGILGREAVELLSDEEAREFVAERRLPIPGEKRSSNRRFLGVTDLSTLSGVYFDQHERWR
jgi:hypothetical protein